MCSLQKNQKAMKGMGKMKAYCFPQPKPLLSFNSVFLIFMWSLSFFVCALLLSCVQFFVTLWSVAHQVHLSMIFSRQEYWSRCYLLSPGDLPNPGIEPVTPALQVDSLSVEPSGKPLFIYTQIENVPLCIYQYILCIKLPRWHYW